MGFKSVAELAAAIEAGQTWSVSYRRYPSNGNTSGTWVDTSGASGYPPANYYAAPPAAAAYMDDSRQIYCGADVAPAKKYLYSWVHDCQGPWTASWPHVIFLLDYLLFYPFVSLEDPGYLPLENPVSLTRYADGEGVQIMMVSQSVTSAAPATLTIDYVNQDGVAKTTPSFRTLNSAVVGELLTSMNNGSPLANHAGGGPFVPLAAGDTGVRQLTGITLSQGDAAICALVLVKPIAQIAHLDPTFPVEKNFLTETGFLPEIAPGARLNYVAWAPRSVNQIMQYGTLNFVWN